MRRWVSYIRLHQAQAAYALGGMFIVGWTLLRFFTERTIFDLVGQQVMTQQWLDGHFAGGSLGVTNYILKMIFLYAPLDVLPGSPRISLLILTLLVNLTAYVLIAVLARRILRYFDVADGEGLYAGVIWLAMAAGSVFWIQFTNSRNLEIAGGLLLLCWGLYYLRRPTTKSLLGLTAYCGVLFFADSLQAYMTAAPLIVYAAATNRKQLRVPVQLAVAVVIGFVVSKALFALAAIVLSVDFLAVTQSSNLNMAFIVEGVRGSLVSTGHLLLGGADAGKLREVVNGLFLLSVVAGAVYTTWKRLVPRRLMVLLGLIAFGNIGVYILSGQAQQAATERYLIMLAPVIVLLCATTQPLINRHKKIAFLGFSLVVLVNAFSLGTTLVKKWDVHFTQDNHLRAVQTFMSAHNNTQFYSSMDTSLPLAYLSGSYTRAPLPLTCNAHGLAKTNTFYTKSAYSSLEQKPAARYALILDGSSITNVPNVCSEAEVVGQLGEPDERLRTDDGSVVLVYRTSMSLDY